MKNRVMGISKTDKMVILPGIAQTVQCKRCGLVHPKTDTFCKECGQALSDVVQEKQDELTKLLKEHGLYDKILTLIETETVVGKE